MKKPHVAAISQCFRERHTACVRLKVGTNQESTFSPLLEGFGRILRNSVRICRRLCARHPIFMDLQILLDFKMEWCSLWQN